MSFLLHPLLRSAQCLRPSIRPYSRRLLSYSLVLRSAPAEQSESAEQVVQEAEEKKDAEEEKADENEQDSLEGEKSDPESYRAFMEQIAPAFKTISTPRNWLGGRVPFPMNRSFQPPPPLSDAQREHMYKLYMKDPKANSVRVLSERFHLSLKRVDAILRLKGMEHAWKKEGKTLQTGFVAGMERILGVPEFNPQSMQDLKERANTDAADSLEELEKRDAARNRYQRLYWETVAEHGGEPILPARLEHSKRLAVRSAEISRQKKDKAYLPNIPDTDTIKTPKEPVQLSVSEGRPTIKFVDVGTKFLDPIAEEQRLAKIDRRVRQRTKKLEENNLLKQ